MFPDNFFASLPLVEYLKPEGIWYTGTIRTPRSKKVPLLAAKDLKLKANGRTSWENRHSNMVWQESHNTGLLICWC